MAKVQLSWTEKLNASKPPIVKPAPISFAGMRARQIMLIPSPKLLDDYIRKIPVGKTLDMATIRSQMAKAHRAEVSCPVTTGIFLRIVVEAANEAHEKRRPIKDITPVWRVIDAKAAILKKVSFDPAWMMAERAKEGL
jgi:hypothetical protein